MPCISNLHSCSFLFVPFLLQNNYKICCYIFVNFSRFLPPPISPGYATPTRFVSSLILSQSNLLLLSSHDYGIGQKVGKRWGEGESKEWGLSTICSLCRGEGPYHSFKSCQPLIITTTNFKGTEPHVPIIGNSLLCSHWYQVKDWLQVKTFTAASPISVKLRVHVHSFIKHSHVYSFLFIPKWIMHLALATCSSLPRD